MTVATMRPKPTTQWCPILRFSQRLHPEQLRLLQSLGRCTQRRGMSRGLWAGVGAGVRGHYRQPASRGRRNERLQPGVLTQPGALHACAPLVPSCTSPRPRKSPPDGAVAHTRTAARRFVLALPPRSSRAPATPDHPPPVPAPQVDVEDVRREVQIMHHLAGHPNIVDLKGRSREWGWGEQASATEVFVGAVGGLQRGAAARWRGMALRDGSGGMGARGGGRREVQIMHHLNVHPNVVDLRGRSGGWGPGVGCRDGDWSARRGLGCGEGRAE